MENDNHSKRKAYSLAQQGFDLFIRFPDSKIKVYKRKLYWSAKIKPTPLSREYSIIIVYRLYCNPRVYVIGEELKKLDDLDFPHNYSIDINRKKVDVCLCKECDFSANQLLSLTIIPWVIEWLFHYEIWLYTGVWNGGGEHPTT